MTWYQDRWWYIERPFPWLIILLYSSVLMGILTFAIFLGIWWFA